MYINRLNATIARDSVVIIKNSRGKYIAKITSVQSDTSILCHAIVDATTLQPVKGKYGGIVFNVSDITSVLDTLID